MRTRASKISLLGEMRRPKAARWLALAALLLAGGTQLVASFHEMAVRHVLCAAHGELTHVKVATATQGSSADLADDASPASTVAGPVETGAAEAHEHCAVALIVQTGTQAPSAPVATRLQPPQAPTHLTPVALPCPGRAVVLASAPKTSPPSA